MHAKPDEQARSRTLRALGLSLREISRELRVSLSSASVWTRDVERPPASTGASRPPSVSWEPAQICNGCGRMLLASDFHRGQSRCKECRQEYIRNRGDLHRLQVRRARDVRRAAARAYVSEILVSGNCVDCGLADPAVLEDCGEPDPVVLDFDHVGVKLSGVVQLADRECSLTRLAKEIQECEVRWANCHRRRTIAEQGHFRNDLVTPP